MARDSGIDRQRMPTRTTAKRRQVQAHGLKIEQTGSTSTRQKRSEIAPGHRSASLASASPDPEFCGPAGFLPATVIVRLSWRHPARNRLHGEASELESIETLGSY